MRRRYRRRSSIFSDINHIGSKLSWWSALIFGVITFTAFYYLIPMWLEAKLASRSSSNIYPVLEAIFGRRIHWFEYVGTTSGIVCLYYSVRNYCFSSTANWKERSMVSILSKIIGRKID
jgi:hypothetical protein